VDGRSIAGVKGRGGEREEGEGGGGEKRWRRDRRRLGRCKRKARNRGSA